MKSKARQLKSQIKTWPIRPRANVIGIIACDEEREKGGKLKGGSESWIDIICPVDFFSTQIILF